MRVALSVAIILGVFFLNNTVFCIHLDKGKAHLETLKLFEKGKVVHIKRGKAVFKVSKLPLPTNKRFLSLPLYTFIRAHKPPKTFLSKFPQTLAGVKLLI